MELTSRILSGHSSNFALLAQSSTIKSSRISICVLCLTLKKMNICLMLQWDSFHFLGEVGVRKTRMNTHTHKSMVAKLASYKTPYTPSMEIIHRICKIKRNSSKSSHDS